MWREKVPSYLLRSGAGSASRGLMLVGHTRRGGVAGTGVGTPRATETFEGGDGPGSKG